MKNILALLFALQFCSQVMAQITAVTEEGKAVILFSDGTWRYRNDSAWIPHAGIRHYSVPANSTALLGGARAACRMLYQADQWSILPDTLYPHADFSLQNHDGEVIAMIISEKMQLPLQKMKDAAVDNFKKTGTEFKVSGEQRIIVNDTEGMLLKIDALVDGIPFSYLNAYFSTPQGTCQVITFTAYNLFDRYRNDMMDLISGFSVTDP